MAPFHWWPRKLLFVSGRGSGIVWSQQFDQSGALGLAELKRILNQRIAELEGCAATHLVALPPAKLKQAMDS